MYTKKDLLIQSAARIYTLGVDVEGAREELRRLVAEGVSYNSPEMKAALKNFQELNEQWLTLEKEHRQFQARLLSR